MAAPFRLVLVARHSALLAAFEQEFAGSEAVTIVQADIVSVPGIDAVVSPANAFGWMDGGVDQVYVYAFGAAIEAQVQRLIRERYHGLMPVGEAMVVETGHSSIRHLVVAPTMKVPGPAKGTQNAYLATRAALQAVVAHNQNSADSIRCLAFPGMATGTGGIPAPDAARQMRQAMDEVFGPG